MAGCVAMVRVNMYKYLQLSRNYFTKPDDIWKEANGAFSNVLSVIELDRKVFKQDTKMSSVDAIK